jgi:hypothetical protein
MLYELRPDRFPHGYLTPVETVLWGRFFEQLNQDRK